MSIPMSTPEPWTLVAEGDATETQPAVEQYCLAALAATEFQDTDKVLDVACGPGTLSVLIHDQVREVHSVDFSQGMLDRLQREIALRGIRNVTPYLMDGQNLEFPDNSFDWAFSIFGLMLFPDRDGGFSEMMRALKPGGRADVTSLAPIADSSAMQAMFGAMLAAFPDDRPGDDRKGLDLDDPDNLRQELVSTGFSDVRITTFEGR